MALKELEARYATIRAKDYKLTDGEGLYLLVRANGSKLRRMKYRFGGKERLLAFAALSRCQPGQPAIQLNISATCSNQSRRPGIWRGRSG